MTLSTRLSRILLFFTLLNFLFVCHSPAQNPSLEEANALNQQVVKLYQQGRYSDAITVAEKALAINEKVLGAEHPKVATSLNNLAMLYYYLGEYARSKPLYLRALAIREKTLGAEHPKVALSLNNLAMLYYYLGDYARAEPLLKRALAIREKALGAEHPHVATSLNNLALLYDSLGDYTRAEPLYLRALAIDEKALGAEHPDVAQILNNLAALYYYLGDYARAEPLYLRALAIREKALGAEHPDVAQSLNNLAGLYHFLGDDAQAEPLLKRALAIREKALGAEHPDVANSLNNLAELYRKLGDYARAEPLYQRALDIYEKALGAEHPDVATSLNNLAIFNASITNFKKAHSLFKKALRIDEKLIDQAMGFTSEEQKIRFLATREGELHAFLNLVNQHLAQEPSARRDALDAWLRRKGVILEAQKRFQEALLYTDNPEALEIFHELAGLRTRLSKAVFAKPGKEGAQKYKQNIAGLEKRIDTLEAGLSRISSAYALKKKIAKADCAKTAQALPADTVLIEFAKIKILNFKDTGKEEKWHPPHYLSFLLYAGLPVRVGLIDLGDAAFIDHAVAEYKHEIKTGKDTLEAGRKVYDAVFAPLKKELGDIKEVFLSPDGNLNLIPFEVLPGADGRFLIEDYTFCYLAAGRDAAGFGEKREKGGKALLIGDPDFDMKAPDAANAKPAKTSQPRAGQKYLAQRSADMREMHFDRLPGTREEVKAIRTILGSQNAVLYTGRDALETVLTKAGRPPSILHLATHGFFLSDIETEAFTDKNTGMMALSAAPPARAGKKVKIENPLLRSGIVLAGANRTLKSGQTQQSGGIVTAEKILGLKLRGTDLTVLSACETGLGDVKAGEGVYGLRRAFTQAGTRSLVMSMWPVPDRETKELMVNFYKNITAGKMKRSQALRQAALKQMGIVKQRYGQANPLLWGAFVFMGEP